jgi:2-keto-4-pentenoate hydratase/2-oxohepta-3-ene-1,7-dioic acid hydratase in catechol pathway
MNLKPLKRLEEGGCLRGIRLWGIIETGGIMKLVRFKYKSFFGWGLVRNGIVHILSGDIYAGVAETKEMIPYDEVKILPPVSPSKIIAVGLNYFGLAKSVNMPVPEEPILFLKPPSAIIGPYDDIVLPSNSQRVNYEGELGVIIGKKVKNTSESEAMDYVLGYTAVNDVSAMDYLERDKQQTTRVKGFDTFCAVGPVIATGLDIKDLHIETRVNGKIVQSSTTRDLIFKTAQLIAFISQVMTLLPGDLIATGTPAGVGAMSRGDVVEVEIEGIGILENSVA